MDTSRIAGRTIHVVDVFAEAPLEGNPLAVVCVDAMPQATVRQAFARETNLSETTFLGPVGAGGEAEVRIHTPAEELPFAGHPVLGTAWVARERGGSEDAVRLATGVGPVEVRFEGRGAGALGRLVAPPVRLGAPVDAPRLAAALRLGAADLLDAPFAPRVVSVGPVFLVAMLRSQERLDALAPDESVLVSLLRHANATGVLAVVERPDVAGCEARMFFESHGVREDPATGSAACCLAALLREAGRRGSLVVRQGVRMGRPSMLHLGIEDDAITLGGRVHPVVEGTLAAFA